MASQYGRPDVLSKFENIRVWRKGGSRSRYKPLLLLWAIGRCLANRSRLEVFTDVDAALNQLISRFSPQQVQYMNTHMPFWRLQNDGIWQIDRPDIVRVSSSGNPLRPDLFDNDIRGGLSAEYYQMFRADPHLAISVAYALLNAHFPATLHDDILQAAGFDGISAIRRSVAETSGEYTLNKPDAGRWEFRARLLDIYERRCAVCAYELRLGELQVGVDAAQIKWAAASGPLHSDNGLALCALHHKLFDYGVFTVSHDLQVVVSSAAEGAGVEDALGRHDGRALAVVPQRDADRPAVEYLDWHHKEVFRTPADLRKSA